MKIEVITPSHAEVVDGQLSYSIPQFIKLTAIGRTTIYSEIRKGKLIARKIAGRTLILKADADTYLSGLPVVGG